MPTTQRRYPDYFGRGVHVPATSEIGLHHPYRSFAPADELDRRGLAAASRTEQTSSEYARGKLVFGAYRRTLIRDIVDGRGSLFHNINPDYTSMVLALSAATTAVEMGSSCVVSVNTDVSNGWLSDTNDAAALAFLNSLAGGSRAVLPTLLVPGLYASLHNWVAHDYVRLKERFDLPFRFDMVNWLTYCTEDIYRPGREWSTSQVESEQKGILRDFMAALDPAVAETTAARLAARAKPRRRPLHHRVRGRLRPKTGQPGPRAFPSLTAAVAERATTGS